MKAFFIFFSCFLLICNDLCAQEIIGEISDKQGASDAVLYIKDSSNQFVKEYYRILNKNFRIRIKTVDPKIYVVIAAPGYYPLEKLVTFKADNDIVDLGLIRLKQEEGLLLDTAIVKARSKAYTEKNDTIFYDVSKFLAGNEMVVEDVLKRMPGITVDANGTIKFMGRSIQHVLINGRNIFDENYTLGTRNITAEAIEGVEVLPDYQLEKLLSEFSKGNTAINLKIKEAYLKTSGSIQSKAGIDQNRKIRHEQELFSLGVYNNAAFQSLSNFQNNSRLNQEHLGTNNVSYEKGMNQHVIVPDNSIPASYNSINNKLFSQQLNISFDANKRLMFKFKGGYRNDRLDNFSSLERHSFVSTDTFYFKDNYSHLKKMHDYFVDADMRYEINDRSVLRARVFLTENKNKHPFTIRPYNVSDLINTDINQYYTSKSFRIDYVKKIRNSAYQTIVDFVKKEVNSNLFASDLYYLNDTITDASQYIRQKPIAFKNKHEWFMNLNSWSLSINDEFSYTREHILINDNLNYTGLDNAFEILGNHLNINWRNQQQKNSYSGSISYQYTLNTNPFQVSRYNQSFSIEQGFFLSLKRHSVSLNIMAVRSPLIFKNHYPFDVVLSQRSYLNYGLIDEDQYKATLSISHSYKNIDRTLHVQNSVVYQYTKGLEIADMVITPSSNRAGLIYLSDDINYVSVTHNGNRFFYDARTMLRWSVNYHMGNQYFLMNQLLLKNDFQTFTVRTEINMPIRKIANIVYKAEYVHTRQRTENNPELFISSLNTQLQVDISLLKNIELKGNVIYSIPDLANVSQLSYWQSNAEINYKLSNQKWVLGVDFMNLFNEVEAQRTILSNYSRSVITNRLVPRMALLKVRFLF